MKNITNRIQPKVWTLALLVVLCGCNKHKKDHEHTADSMTHNTVALHTDEHDDHASMTHNGKTVDNPLYSFQAEQYPDSGSEGSSYI